MSFVKINRPALGEGIKKRVIDGVIDNADFFFGFYDSSLEDSVLNGDFEYEDDVVGSTPSFWTFVSYNTAPDDENGVVTDTDSISGSRSFKVTHPGGVGKGGGSMRSDWINVSKRMGIELSWWLKSTDPDVKIVAWLIFSDFDSLENEANWSWKQIWENDGTAPTEWTPFQASAPSSSTGVYCQIRFQVGTTDRSTAADIYLDKIQFGFLQFPKTLSFTTAGSHTWIPNADGIARVTVIGAGGGGSGSSLSRSGGGGAAGGQSVSMIRYTSGSMYGITVGEAGDYGATGSNGSAGGDSYFESFFGLGGAGGIATASSAGGAAFGNCEQYTGGNGRPGIAVVVPGSLGGAAGNTILSGAGGRPGAIVADQTQGEDGSPFGAGGGAGSTLFPGFGVRLGAGGNGASGAVILEYTGTWSS